MQLSNVQLMYIKVFEIKSANFFGENQFKIYWICLEQKVKIKILTIKNVLKCLENVYQNLLNWIF